MEHLDIFNAEFSFRSALRCWYQTSVLPWLFSAAVSGHLLASVRRLCQHADRVSDAGWGLGLGYKGEGAASSPPPKNITTLDRSPVFMKVI